MSETESEWKIKKVESFETKTAEAAAQILKSPDGTIFYGVAEFAKSNRSRIKGKMLFKKDEHCIERMTAARDALDVLIERATEKAKAKAKK